MAGAERDGSVRTDPMSTPQAGLILVAIMVGGAVAAFPFLPAEIPVYGDAAGGPGGGLPRWPGAFILPAVGFGIRALFSILPRCDPRKDEFALFWRTYWLICNLMLLFLALTEAFVFSRALGAPVEGGRFGALAIGLLFLSFSRYLPGVRSRWWLGIRTPWTLQSEGVWAATHRLAGRTFLLGGLVTVVAAFVTTEIRPWLATAGVVIAGFVPVVFSYLARRSERRA